MPTLKPNVSAAVRPSDRLLCLLGALIALGAAVNAYSFSATAAIPLIQSDAWYFLDGYLGRFLENGFSFAELFVQANPEDTDLPLQRLFLFFHTRYFGMDFRLEGILATATAVVGVTYFAAVGARRPLNRWGVAEYGLLAALALFYLSLNSTNIYTWPLAGAWFVPVLLAALYFGFVTRGDERSWVAVAAASFLLGILLDEVAYPVFAAAIGAYLLTHRARTMRRAARMITAGCAGIALTRLIFWWFNRAVHVEMGTAPRSLAPLFTGEVWKALSIPLTESLVAQANLPIVFGAAAALFANAISVALLAAHVWFWLQVMRADRAVTDDARLTRFAAALMLLFYALVLGIVVQRVPTFGFDYLHQPRYVLFYQIHLVALTLMVYRQCARATRVSTVRRAACIFAIGLVLVLQWQLSVLAWKQVKYLSVYVEGVAQSIGKLQSDPSSKMKCADIMTICNFPPPKRAELLDRLLRYRMNVFSTDFQGFYRLHPYGAAPAQAVKLPTEPADLDVAATQSKKGSSPAAAPR